MDKIGEYRRDNSPIDLEELKSRVKKVESSFDEWDHGVNHQMVLNVEEANAIFEEVTRLREKLHGSSGYWGY